MATEIKIYSVKDTAELLGVTPSYIYYLIATKKLKADRIGWAYTISQEEIERYKQEEK